MGSHLRMRTNYTSFQRTLIIYKLAGARDFVHVEVDNCFNRALICFYADIFIWLRCEIIELMFTCKVSFLYVET